MRTIFLLIPLMYVSLFSSPDTVSIYDIQYTDDPSGDSPYSGETVTTGGIVTSIESDWSSTISGFFIQDTSLPWHGLFVYTAGLGVSIERGDSVILIGEVSEYYNMTELRLSSTSDLEIVRTGLKIPAPYPVNTGDIATGSSLAESFEGVLVQVNNIVVEDPDLGYGEWSVNDGTGACRIDDAGGYSYNPTQWDSILSIIGILYYSYSNFKMEPRGDEDIIFDPDGTGNAYVTPDVVPVGAIIDTIIVTIEGVVLDTLKSIELMIPAEISWSEVFELGGPAFSNAVASLEGSGTIENPFVIKITNAELIRGKDGDIYIISTVYPSTVDTLLFEVRTAKEGTPVPISNSPYITVMSISGSGDVSLSQEYIPRGVREDISITISGVIGTITTVEIELPEDTIEWNGNTVLSGNGFSGADVDVTLPNRISITSANITTSNSGTVTLYDLKMTGSLGKYSITVKTAGGTESPVPVSSLPYIFLVSSDSTYPISFFHNDTIKTLLESKGVKVKGVVTAILGQRVFLQDTTGGIVLYNPDESLSQGDEVKLLGTYSPYYGLEELVNTTVLEKVYTGVFDTLSISSLDIKENNEGRLVKIGGVYIPNKSTLVPDSSYTLTDSLEAFLIGIDSNTDLVYRTLPAGTLDCVGVIDEDNGTYRLLPRSTGDVLLYGNGSGEFEYDMPILYIGDAEDTFDIILTAYLHPIKSFRIFIPDTMEYRSVQLIGDGFSGKTIPDTSIYDSTGVELRVFSVNIQTDTIRLIVGVPNTTGEYTITMETSVDTMGPFEGVLSTPALYVVYPISMLQEPGEDGVSSSMEGQTVLVGGVVTGASDVFSSEGMTAFWIYDGTGGVDIYYSETDRTYAMGKFVVVQGTVTEYNGVTEVVYGNPDDVTIIKDSHPLPQATILRESESLKEEMEGSLYILEEGEVASLPSRAGSGMTFEAWNAQVPITMYVYDATGIDLSSIEIGDRVNITGIVGQYDTDSPYTSGYQLQPRRPDDLEVLPEGEITEKPSISVSPNIFAPDLGEVLDIKVSGPQDARYTLRIFDIAGRVIKTFYEGRTGPLDVVWRGLNGRGERVTIGMYIVQLKTVQSNGKRDTKNKLIVLSTPFR